MTERTLLASVVLFRELYDSDKDIYDVIAEFIKAALVFAQKWTVDATNAGHLLTAEFGLSIPEAVIGTTMHNRLYKRDDVLSYDKGIYSVDRTKLDSSQTLTEDLRRLQAQQDDLFSNLYSYIELMRGALSQTQRDLLTDCLCTYLSDDSKTTSFSEEISSFIIASQARQGFTEQLNAVREGFVLYDGVRHTPDLSQLGAWKHKLTVYLDTEHLFNAAGLNGALHEQLFRDFSSLASDVRDKGKKLIILRYFSECNDEIDRFFHAAELILDGKASLDPSKPAMANIIEGCSTRSDVLAKKAHFFSKLKNFGIDEAEIPSHELDASFNLESSQLLETVRKEIEARGREFQEDKCINTLRMFTKINGVRNGVNSGPFERIGHILVSGSFIANYLAFHPGVRSGNSEIPFATGLEFITNRLWFKLHKGLTKRLSRPQSLNVLAKAQVVLASQINSSVSGKFDQIQHDFENGKISKTDVQYLFNELRSKSSTPETLTAENVASALEFLDHKNYHHHLREKSLLLDQVKRGQEAEQELAKIREEKEKKKEQKVTIASWIAHGLFAMMIVGFVIGSYLLCLYFVLELVTDQDSPLAIFAVLLTVVLGTLPLLRFKAIVAWLKGSHMKTIQRFSKERA